jgi:hypothetical protein
VRLRIRALLSVAWLVPVHPPCGFAEVNPRRRDLPCDGSGGHRGRPICCSPLSDLIGSSLQYNIYIYIYMRTLYE